MRDDVVRDGRRLDATLFAAKRAQWLELELPR
jgi:hypothetical protein